jgi:hypothetical protein
VGRKAHTEAGARAIRFDLTGATRPGFVKADFRLMLLGDFAHDRQT